MKLRDGVSRLLHSFKQLQVLYLLLPLHLFDTTEETTAFIEGREQRKGFWLGKREYFEVTPEAEQLRGAERLAKFYQRLLDFSMAQGLEAVLRRKGAGRESFRPMMWRDV